MTQNRRFTALAVIVSTSFLVGAIAAPGAVGDDVKAQQKTFEKDVKPLLKKYCESCHVGSDAPGGYDVAAFKGVETYQKAADKWQKIGDYAKSGVMPPKGAALPSFAERRTIGDWFAHAGLLECNIHNATPVTLVRLNRDEYTNTIRDLLGVQTDVANEFPSDDVGYGFDNIGDVLSTSTLHAEKYFAAASKVARKAIRTETAAPQHFGFANLAPPTGASIGDEGDLGLFSQCTVPYPFSITVSGDYNVQFFGYGDQAGPDFPHLTIGLDGKKQQMFELKTTAEKPVSYEFPLTLTEGNHTLTFTYDNDYYDPKFPDPKRRDRNAHVVSWQISPAVGATPKPSAVQAKILGDGPNGGDELSYAKGALTKLASRAYRRPVTSDEQSRLVNLYSKVRKGGGSWEKSMQVCLVAILCDPNFLFRVEPSKGNLSNYEVATRLSYFLWSSMPDQTLFDAADSGKLSTTEGIRTQVDRMLLDPKARSLSDEFAMQWLQLRKLEGLIADKKTFPEATPSLKNAAITETKLFFNDIVASNRPITDLLTATDTFVNQELAGFYGIPGVEGKKFQHVQQTDPARGGIIGMASFLMVTSNPTRTSPVKRGRFVLEELLGTPPPPPPPNVGVLPDDKKSTAEKPIKERMAIHRSNPACANCHRQMDAIGFCLENFDGVGKWRTMDGTFPVDATGESADGAMLSGPSDVKKMLVSRKDEFARAFAEKLMTFALGRGLTPADTCIVDDVVAQAKRDNYKFHTVVSAIATSDAFRKRT